MSGGRSRRGRSKGKAPAAGKQGSGKQGKKGRNRKGGQRSRPPALDPKRPFWANDAAESDVRAVIGVVRPAEDPTAVVRSLGSPPLGRFADDAQHFYAAVYEKAQHFAVAMATANGVQVAVDGDEDGGAEGGA